MDDKLYHVDKSKFPPAVAVMYMRGEELRVYQREKEILKEEGSKKALARKAAAADAKSGKVSKPIHAHKQIHGQQQPSKSTIQRNLQIKQQYNQLVTPTPSPPQPQPQLTPDAQYTKIIEFLKLTNHPTTCDDVVNNLPGVSISNPVIAKLVRNGNILMCPYEDQLMMQYIYNGILLNTKKSLTKYIKSAQDPYPLKLKDIQFNWKDGALLKFLQMEHEEGRIVFDGENVIPVTDQLMQNYLELIKDI